MEKHLVALGKRIAYLRNKKRLYARKISRIS